MLNRDSWIGEWLIIRRHPLVWIIALVAIAFIAFAASNEAPGDVRKLREAVLRLNLFMPVFVLPFVAGALAPVFYLREVEHGLGEVFAAYPLTLRGWLSARLGGFALLLLAICTVQQAVIFGQLAEAQPAMLAMLAWQSAKLMALVHAPACLIWAYVLARVSCASGKSSMVYLAAAFGWLTYMSLATLTGTPLIAGSFVAAEPLRTAMVLIDPYAITALVSPAPVDGLPQSREIAMVLGRLGWIALCILLVRGIGLIPTLAAPRERAVQEPQGRQNADQLAWSGRLALMLGWIASDKFLLLASAGWALLIFPEVFSGMSYAEPLAILAPDSRDALNRVMWDLVPPTGAFLLLYVADRVSRMDAATGMSELTASTAHPSWRFLCAQLAGLWLVALAFVVYTLLVVLVSQLAGSSAIQPREYLEQGAQSLPGLLLAASAFVSLHAVIRSRMGANLTSLALIVLGHSNLLPNLNLIHPLWKPLRVPLTSPDHILGIDANWAVLLPYALFWTAICGAAAMLAIILHHRGLPYRQTGWRQAATHMAMIPAALLVAAAVWQGWVVDTMLEHDSALISADDRAQRRADYERRYGDWLRRAQPDVSEIASSIDFGDDGRSADLRMAMQLINRTESPIERILIGGNLVNVTGTLTTTGSIVEARDPALGQTVFRFSEPMHPGDVRTLHFGARVERSVLSGKHGLLILRREFGSLPVFQIAPLVGFQREFMLRDPLRRAEFGLPPLAIAPPSRLGPQRPSLPAHRARLVTQVSVPRGYHAVAPGELVRSWDEGNRSHFKFRTDRAIRNLPMVFALPWPPQRWPVGTLQAEIYSPEQISENDANLLGMRDTLAWLDREIAPYPGQTLRLIAAPEFGSGGFAVPQAMMISHRRGFRAWPAPDAEFDQAYRRAVHETAHQWFGHLLGYGIAEERAFLIESLAKYAELVMVDRRYGKQAAQSLVAWEADRYSRARLAPQQSSVALIDAEDTEDMYSRATLAFDCLRTRVGDAAIIDALRSIAASAQEAGRPVRSLDFVGALKRAGGKTNEGAVDALLTHDRAIDEALAEASCLKAS